MNMEHVGIALEIMGKGMGGIFAATIIIMAAVMVLGRINRKAGSIPAKSVNVSCCGKVGEMLISNIAILQNL